jgi:hypothetical protein
MVEIVKIEWPVFPEEVAPAVIQAMNTYSRTYKRFAACVRFYYKRKDGEEFFDIYYFVRTVVGNAIVAMTSDRRPIAAGGERDIYSIARKVFRYAKKKRGTDPERADVIPMPEEIAFSDWFE